MKAINAGADASVEVSKLKLLLLHTHYITMNIFAYILLHAESQRKSKSG